MSSMPARRLGTFLTFALVVAAPHLGAQHSTKPSPATRPTGRASSSVSAPTWTPDAIKADPAGFIAYATPHLRAKITAAAAVHRDVSDAWYKLNHLRNQYDKKLDSNQTALRISKETFQSASGHWPLLMAGREYDEPAFMKEVDRLLDEHSALVAVQNQVEAAAHEASRKSESLAMQVQIDRVTLDVLEAYKPMLREPRPPSVEGALERALLGANERLATAEESTAPAAIRTVEELMKGAASRASRLTAAEFLKRGPDSRR
jgi:hypothetical protein